MNEWLKLMKLQRDPPFSSSSELMLSHGLPYFRTIQAPHFLGKRTADILKGLEESLGYFEHILWQILLVKCIVSKRMW